MPNSDDFETILTSHLDDMYALALRLTGSKDNAEDLVHDLFVNLSVKRYRNREIHRPRAWLAAILYRIFVDQWRRKVNAPVQYWCNLNYDDSNQRNNIVASLQPDPHRALEIDDEKQRLQQALDMLNERQRQIVVLHEIEGYTMDEIGQIMSIPLGTVKSNLFRARDKLHENLYRNNPEADLQTAPKVKSKTADRNAATDTVNKDDKHSRNDTGQQV